MSTLREELISIISVGANNISKVEKLEKLFKQQMLDLLKDEFEVGFEDKDWLRIKAYNKFRAQLRQEVEKL